MPRWDDWTEAEEDPYLRADPWQGGDDGEAAPSQEMLDMHPMMMELD